jgi:riboflavin kinase/FMN adenylyltransferase
MDILFTIKGPVKKGAQRGREFGYPTANVSLENHIPEGIYASQVVVGGQTYNAATFIGSAKTFGDKEYKSESYIFNFTKEIYGQEITIHLYKRIRGSEKFVDEKTLIKQIDQDVARVKDFFTTTS